MLEIFGGRDQTDVTVYLLLCIAREVETFSRGEYAEIEGASVYFSRVSSTHYLFSLLS